MKLSGSNLTNKSTAIYLYNNGRLVINDDILTNINKGLIEVNITLNIINIDSYCIYCKTDYYNTAFINSINNITLSNNYGYGVCYDSRAYTSLSTYNLNFKYCIIDTYDEDIILYPLGSESQNGFLSLNLDDSTLYTYANENINSNSKLTTLDINVNDQSKLYINNNRTTPIPYNTYNSNN